MGSVAFLPQRSVVAVSGADRVSFLQGLVSNDVAEAAPGRAVWAALLTPQGRYLADFFIVADRERLLLDCDRSQTATVTARLGRFRLRADVRLGDTPLAVFAGWGAAPPPAGAAADSRLAEAGWRLLTAGPPPAPDADADAYDRHRIALGLPDGARDCETEKTLLLEAGFDELGGISWSKGCYMGQELTARTKYRGLVKRRLFPVTGADALPPEGTSILRDDGGEAGLLRSVRGSAGLAMLRLDAHHAALRAGDVPLTVRVPPWMRLPEPAVVSAGG